MSEKEKFLEMEKEKDRAGEFQMAKRSKACSVVSWRLPIQMKDILVRYRKQMNTTLTEVTEHNACRNGRAIRVSLNTRARD